MKGIDINYEEIKELIENFKNTICGKSPVMSVIF